MKNNYNFFIMLLVIILILCFLFYIIKKRNIESYLSNNLSESDSYSLNNLSESESNSLNNFSDSESYSSNNLLNSSIYFNTKNKFLNNCSNGYSKSFDMNSEDCQNNSWVDDPKFLCAICDGEVGGEMYNINDESKSFYGCSKNTSNGYGLSWDQNNTYGEYDELSKFSSKILSNCGEIKKWVYENSKNTWWDLKENNLVSKWKDVNIKKTSEMSISFYIYISNLNSNWRNIFHVSNQNVNCCDVGNRVPSMWLCQNNTQVYIINSTKTEGNNGVCSSYQISLNKPTFISVVFDKNKMNFYADGQLQQTYNYDDDLIDAKDDAYFYIADPWYPCSGIKIFNFTIYDHVLDSNDAFNLFKVSKQNKKILDIYS